MKKKLLVTIFSGVVALGAFSNTKHTILTVRDSFVDTTSVMPESFETGTEQLLQNWYIQNYTILDEEVENKTTGEVSEEEYIKRLSKMPTIIEMPYNQEVRRYIDAYVVRRRTMIEAMLGMSLYYMPIFEQALEKEELPLELKYLPIVESALNPVAKSQVGAAGLWQFMLKTGKGLGLEVNSLVDERLDPYKSSEKAAKYLKQLHSIYGDWSLAIAAYNCGPGKVNQALRQAGGTGKDFWQIYAFLPKETRGYVPAFIAANYAMTYYKHHNISPALAKKPIVVDTVTVNRRIHFNQISSVIGVPVEALRVLNPQYRTDVIPGNVRPYTLALPSQQIYSFLMSEDSIATSKAAAQPRMVVEPQMEAVASDEGGEYVWETKTVTKTHKVRSGESLGRIASKYKTTVTAIKNANGLKSNNIQVGKVLKIKVKERVKVYKPAAKPSEEELAEADSLALEAAIAGANENKSTAKQATARPAAKKPATTKTTSKPAQTTPAKKPATTSQPTTHTVKSGESFYLIAKRYGVTIDAIKKANGLTSDKLKPGQKLKIPKKATTTNTRSTAKTTKKK